MLKFLFKFLFTVVVFVFVMISWTIAVTFIYSKESAAKEFKYWINLLFDFWDIKLEVLNR